MKFLQSHPWLSNSRQYTNYFRQLWTIYDQIRSLSQFDGIWFYTFNKSVKLERTESVGRRPLWAQEDLPRSEKCSSHTDLHLIGHSGGENLPTTVSNKNWTNKLECYISLTIFFIIKSSVKIPILVTSLIGINKFTLTLYTHACPESQKEQVKK